MMTLLRLARRRLGFLGTGAILFALWHDRHDALRWWSFVKRSLRRRESTPMSAVLTEAKVRAAITADPVLRRDRAIEDLSVEDGVVTLHTTAPSWPERDRHLVRLRSIRGVYDVICIADPVPSAV